VESSLPDDDPTLFKKELQLSIRLILEMGRMCRETGIHFVLLRLTKAEYSLYDDIKVRDPLVFAELQSAQVTILDLREVPGDRFPTDHHRNAQWHANVAQSIPATPFIKTVIGEGT